MVLSGMLIAALLAIGALGLWQGHQMSALLDTMYADRVVPLKQIKAVSDAYAVQIVDVVHKFADGSIDGQEALRHLDVAQGTIHSEWRAYTSTFLVPDEKQLIEKLTPLRDRVDATLPRLRQAFADNDRAFADQFRVGEMYPMFDAMQGVIGDLVNVQLSISEQINAEAYALKQRSFWTSAASIALAIVAAMVLCASIIRHLMRSLGTEPTELKVIAQQVASGDLRPIQLQSAAPAGSVLQALVDMQGHLWPRWSTRSEMAVKVSLPHRPRLPWATPTSASAQKNRPAICSRRPHPWNSCQAPFGKARTLPFRLTNLPALRHRLHNKAANWWKWWCTPCRTSLHPHVALQTSLA